MFVRSIHSLSAWLLTMGRRTCGGALRLRPLAIALALVTMSARDGRAQQHLFAEGPTKYTFAGCNVGRSCHTFELFVGVPSAAVAPVLGTALGAVWRATNTFYETGAVHWYWYLDDSFNSISCEQFGAIGTCVDDLWGTLATGGPARTNIPLRWPLHGVALPSVLRPNLYYFPEGESWNSQYAENTTVIMPLVSVTVLPEPGSAMLAAAGLLALLIAARVRSRSSAVQ